MEIVIKIDEKDYNLAYDLISGVEPKFCRDRIYKAIAIGTVLPKGHGRLIAEPTETDISNTIGGNNDFAECIRDSVKAVFDNATTIIEADKG